jgi:hypothetical protein
MSTDLLGVVDPYLKAGHITATSHRCSSEAERRPRLGRPNRSFEASGAT